MVEVNEPGACVSVDDEKAQVEISRKGDKEKITVSVSPGKHKLRVEKEGFTFFTQEFAIKARGSVVIQARLERPKLPPRFKNSLGMEFVLVPKGTFWMGGGGGEVDKKKVEIEQDFYPKDPRPYWGMPAGKKKVEMEQDFYLGVYEVTQGEWQAVTGVNPSHFSREGGGKEAVKDISDADLRRFPVENISWTEARLFAVALTLREKEAGWQYRLPMEAEWEYACRGGQRADKSEYGYNFYFEKPTNELRPDQANWEHGQGLKRSCKVGSYKPNSLGLYDMHGNVAELCDDEEKWDNGESRRVARSGSWGFGTDRCRAAFHMTAPASFRANDLGVRLARVPVTPKDNNPPAQAPQQDRRPEEVLTNSLGMKFALSTPGKYALSVRFSPDGKRLLAAAQYGLFKIYDVESGTTILSVEYGLTWIRCLTWSPDGKHFAVRKGLTDGFDDVLICNAQTGKPDLPVLKCGAEARSLAWSPDGQTLAVGVRKKEPGYLFGKGRVVLFRTQSGQQVGASAYADWPCDGIAWSPDGQRLAASGQRLRVWDSTLLKEIPVAKTPAVCLCWSPDGKQLAVGGGDQPDHGDGTIKIYDAKSWVPITDIVDPMHDLVCLAWHPRLPRLASGNQLGAIKIWDTEMGQELLARETSADTRYRRIQQLDRNPDGLRLASASMDCMVRIWDASMATRVLKK